MSSRLDRRIAFFSQADTKHLLKELQRGIEKESLRINSDGSLAQTQHPEALGSALTHPSITTDFSEALLEFVTPVSNDIATCLSQLEHIHRYATESIDAEQMWPSSMPCKLPADDDIPIATYGTSNIAQMKMAYRRGLGYRYGRKMQTIAGIHYNFSLPQSLWQHLHNSDNNKLPLQDYITEGYFDLIRNFQRLVWLPIYLFGASPAVCSCFVNDSAHQLESFDSNDYSFHLPYATSLRMSDLGYQSNAQKNLDVCYNNLNNYISTLKQAITISHPDYEKTGVKVDGVYRQLNTSLLQIENEFYSPIRPKRVTKSGEIPLGALRSRGVEYVEVRCIDLNPYLPLGIDAAQIRFLDMFLLYCIFNDSPLCMDTKRCEITENIKRIVNEGRKPDLQLLREGNETSMTGWANQVLNDLDAIAALLDDAHGCKLYSASLDAQKDKVANSKLTPSAMILNDMRAEDVPFFYFSMQKSQQHKSYFQQQALEEKIHQQFVLQSEESLAAQHQIEQSDEIDFDTFLQKFFSQYDALD